MNNFGEEEIEIDMKYIKETAGMMMIVDSGVPMSIVSDKWLDKYIEGIRLRGKLSEKVQVWKKTYTQALRR